MGERFTPKGASLQTPYAVTEQPLKSCMVEMTGLEPARLAALEPKSSVSANFTTSR